MTTHTEDAMTRERALLTRWLALEDAGAALADAALVSDTRTALASTMQEPPPAADAEEIPAEIVRIALREFAKFSPSLGYVEEAKWHLNDIQRMRAALTAARAKLSEKGGAG